VKTILLSIPDLMFETRVADAARKLGHRVESFSADKLADANLLIVGLENNRIWNSIVESARKQHVPILAFGRHTSADLLRQAREAGCTRVVVNSDIEDFPKLLEEFFPSPVP
jgi:hypothetical protein